MTPGRARRLPPCVTVEHGRLGHAAGAVVVASVVAVDPGGWYPFTVAKFTAVALALTWCWWEAMRHPGGRRLPRSLAVVWWVLLALLGIAALAGREPWYAWIGTPERSLGWLTWVGFAAAATAGARLTAHDRRVLVRWCVVAGVMVGVYGVIERFIGPPIDTASSGGRLGGPYGSASMLGAALCLLLPVAAGLAVDRDERREWRWAANVALGLGGFVVVGTGTRAAWVGLVVAAVVVAAAHRRHLVRPVGRLAVSAASVVAGALVAVIASPDAAGRVVGASGSRLDEWGVGWRIVRSHPWLGVGPEGYRTVLADGVSTVYERSYGRDVTPDRAHHVVLDVAAAGGVFAAAVFVVAVGIVLWVAWGRMRVGGALDMGVAAALVAYSVQQLFLFPVATIDPIWWLLAGWVAASEWSGTRADAMPGSRAVWRRRTVTAMAVTVALVVALAGVAGLAADRAASAAVRGVGAADLAGRPVGSDDSSVAAALRSAERAVALRPDVVRYRLLAADLAANRGTIDGIRAALTHTADALAISPHDPIVLLADADYASLLATRTGRHTDIDDALQRWVALGRDDNCYRCQLGLGYTAALAGDRPQAFGGFRRAVQLAPAGDDEAAIALELLTVDTP